jgi:NADPH:quinone reductase-like Zn-dependent oxidoreductase
MKAIRIHEFGGPQVLRYEEVERPEPKEDEVLVRVHAAGVGVWEADIRAGGWQGYIEYPLPLILGTDMAGTVEAVGPKVKKFQVGDEVFGVADMTLSGAYAEFALAKEDAIARKPKSLNFVQAASVPVSAVTAWMMLFDLGELKPKQKLLIHGAAGAVGSYAVQLAKSEGAYVIAAASKKDEQYVRALGADEFVDYHREKFEDHIRKVDLVIDLVAGNTRKRSFDVINKGGALITAPEPVSAEDKKLAKKHGVRVKFVECVPTKKLLKKIAGLIDAGILKTNTAAVLPLEQAKRAQTLLDKHKTAHGKVVLKVA